LTLHFDYHAIGAVVLDIEGTTTPIAFVYDVLFPFARRHLREYLNHADGVRVREAIGHLREERAADRVRGDEPPPWTDEADAELSSAAAYAEWLMDRDSKSTGLKRLQGHIWERGYESGELKGDIFPDVRPAIEKWRAARIDVAIYSSGSVLAQRLLFAHTRDGDLTPCFSAFFDTEIGAKTSPDSYRRIAAALGSSPGRLLFVSDMAKELDAAHAAGCRVVLCSRPGNAPQPPTVAVDVINSLEELNELRR
jgi:enolase-phosphatase E1